MASRRSSSAYVLPPGGAWTERHPTFGRTVKELFKKAFLIKIRHPASIIEFAIALVIYIALYPVWFLARRDIPGLENPPLVYNNPFRSMAMFFVGTGQPTLVAFPDVQEMHDIINFSNIGQYLKAFNVTSEFQYVNTQKEMEDKIYASDANGIGIHWANYDEKENNKYIFSPRFEIYRQTLTSTIDAELTLMLQKACLQFIAQTPQNSVYTQSMKLAHMIRANFTQQEFAKPSSESVFDISIAIEFFAILPIILATMPDVQSILEEKDSKVMSLTFLMGCSEGAFWLVNIITQFVLSFIPYFFFCVMLCFGFSMKNTSFTLMLVISILFIISHIFFQLWIITFLKSGSAGRALTVVFLVFTLFFGYLHFFFTLSPDNNSGALKHVFSLIPLSCYQMVLMSNYRQELNTLPAMTWSNMGNDSVYPAWWALVWLFSDCVIFSFLFFIFNLTMPRNFCTSPLRWSELFSISAWKRFLGAPDVATEQVSSQSEEFIRVQGLKKVYKSKKDITAIDDIDFFVKRGEVIVMIGPNGAGKSTLINILAGAIEPTEGKVNILGGEETNRFKELQKYLGVCFQENVIINLLSVREHLYLFGSFRGVPNDQIDEAVEFFGSQLQLTHMLENRAGDLSGGQKRKLCIAMSLLGNPPLVIMDEPTAGVDVQARQLIWKMISCLKNTTTIVTSHALEEAEAVSSRLFISSSGKMPFCGTSTELRSQYKCGYILRVESESGSPDKILELVKNIIPDTSMNEERNDTIMLPVCDQIPRLLKELESKKTEVGLKTYAFSVEQLEDMLLKLIQADEAKFQAE